MIGRVSSIVAAAGLLAVTSFGALDRTAAAVPAEARPAQRPASIFPAAFRRLNEAQYLNSIRDIFGADIKVPGRFDPPLRDEGLMAIGDGHVAISSSSFEQNELRARNIASQVFDKDRKAKFLSCPAEPKIAATPCVRSFFEKYGRLLYRRPLEGGEVAALLAVTDATARMTGSFDRGLEAGLSRLLTSPNFLFRIEWAQQDAAGKAATRLDDYALATRMSFLLWNAPPDEELLDVAQRGDLSRQTILAAQTDRLIASPRFEQGVRAFFSDMLAYEGFEGLAKDQTLFPIFTSQLAKDAREQTLRTIVNHLVTEKGDYRDLFSLRTTFMNRNLGALYGVPVEASGANDWAPHTFGAQEQRVGLLTLAAFLMLDPTHEGRTAPTNRGKALREHLLCQTVPPPPSNVDFTEFETNKGGFKTTRERLAVHAENPTCAGCHSLTDPIGLALENYDTLGNFRTAENGETIDATGTFEGRPFKDAIELQALLRGSPTVPACVTQRLYEYGVGRSVKADEETTIERFGNQFAKDNYAFVGLVRTIVTSDAFRLVAPRQRLAAK